MKKIKPSTKLAIKTFPKLFLKFYASKQGINYKKIDWAEKLFRDCKRIDIEPLSGPSRGFIIFLDNKFSLWFLQDGNHFAYDGFEMGEYENGEVTVFDNLNNN